MCKIFSPISIIMMPCSTQPIFSFHTNTSHQNLSAFLNLQNFYAYGVIQLVVKWSLNLNRHCSKRNRPRSDGRSILLLQELLLSHCHAQHIRIYNASKNFSTLYFQNKYNRNQHCLDTIDQALSPSSNPVSLPIQLTLQD